MKFRYETHLHTSISSRCSRFTAEEIVRHYLENGYSGVFVTDHFLNGNTTVHEKVPESAGYRERIDAYLEGYRAVKRAAEGTELDVFLGIEYSYYGSDILVYGFSEEELFSMEDILGMQPNDFCDYCRARGYIAIQAHPFRTAAYIPHIRIFDRVEGIEIFNACRTESENTLARFYAQETGKIPFGGSDAHRSNLTRLSGVALDEKVKDEAHFVELLRQGSHEIVCRENVYTETKI